MTYYKLELSQNSLEIDSKYIWMIFFKFYFSGSMMSSSATSRQKSPLIDPPLGEKCSKPIKEMEKFSTKNSLLLVDPDKFSRQITLV